MKDNFIEDFNKALEKTNDNHLLNQLERIADLFVVGENSQENYVNFQIQLMTLIGSDNTPVILHFLKSDIDINPDKNQRKTYAILSKIRFLVKHKLNSVETSLSNPFRLSGHMFSFNEELPFHLTSTISRNDGESIKFLMNINEGIMLMHGLATNLSDKFDKGANNIDRSIYFEFKKAMRQFERKVDTLIETENATTNDKEETVLR